MPLTGVSKAKPEGNAVSCSGFYLSYQITTLQSQNFRKITMKGPFTDEDWILNKCMHHEVICERLWLVLSRRGKHLCYVTVEEEVAVAVWYLTTGQCLFPYALQLAFLLFWDWKRSCIYTCYKLGHNVSLTTSGGILADQITVCSNCLLGALTRIHKCDQVLFNCNPITWEKFQSKEEYFCFPKCNNV